MGNDYFDMLSQNAGSKQEEPKAEQKEAMATLVLRCDADCFALCDGALIATLKAGQISKAEIQTGQHLIEFQSEEFSKEKIELIVDVPDVGKSYLAIGEGLAKKVDENKEVTKEMMINGCQGTYTGHLKDGKPSGVGTFAYADGRCYKGEFVDGKFKGNGIFTWPDGGRYEGEWAGLMNGRGVYTWPDGGRYEGEWANDKKHGKGVYITAQGNRCEQVWEEGCLIFGNQTFTVNGVQFTMVAVEGGTFTMGATSEQGSDAGGDEKPAHEVTLSDYYIGQTEVTQALWKAVMGGNPSFFKGDNLPVESVSWDDCQEFIQKLNQLTGKQFRLPTEAEWEYAARGGRKSRGYKYAGGNDIGLVAWYDGNSGNGTYPVATKQANELGIYDMSGNVWEWCSDWYGDYQSSSQSDPQGPSSGFGRVDRGGGCYDGARNCRVSVRGNDTPDFRGNLLGLRLSCNR